MWLKMNGLQLNLRGVGVKDRDPLLQASSESRVAFQLTNELDPDGPLMFWATCMQGINFHLDKHKSDYDMSSHIY